MAEPSLCECTLAISGKLCAGESKGFPVELHLSQGLPPAAMLIRDSRVGVLFQSWDVDPIKDIKTNGEGLNSGLLVPSKSVALS